MTPDPQTDPIGAALAIADAEMLKDYQEKYFYDPKKQKLREAICETIARLPHQLTKEQLMKNSGWDLSSSGWKLPLSAGK